MERGINVEDDSAFTLDIYLNALPILLILFVIQVLYQIPVAGSIFSLVDVLFIFREDHKCIHDLIADTIVIDVEFEKQDVVEEM